MTAIPNKPCKDLATTVAISNPGINRNRPGVLFLPVCERHSKRMRKGTIFRDLTEEEQGKICKSNDPIPGAFGAPPPVSRHMQTGAWKERMRAYQEQMKRLREAP